MTYSAPNPQFKVAPLFDVESTIQLTRQRHIDNDILLGTYKLRLLSGVVANDLERP